jgi:ABC-type uncharacterized transport system substrate-binding protein
MVARPQNAGLTQGPAAGGISMDVPVGEQIALMTRALGKIKTIGMLYCSDVPASAAMQKEMEQAMPAGVRLLAVDVKKHQSMADAIAALLAQGPDIVWTAPDSSVYDGATIRSLLLASVRNRIPVFGFSTAFVKAGALLGIGIDPRAQGEQAATMVAGVIKSRAKGAGAVSKPAGGNTTTSSASATSVAASSPACVVEAPKFQVVLNLIVAAGDRLSISLPAEMTRSADVVFRPEEDKQ